MQNRCHYCPGLDPDVALADVDYFWGRCGRNQTIVMVEQEMERETIEGRIIESRKERERKKGEWNNWVNYIFWFNLGFVVCDLLGLP